MKAASPASMKNLELRVSKLDSEVEGIREEVQLLRADLTRPVGDGILSPARASGSSTSVGAAPQEKTPEAARPGEGLLGPQEERLARTEKRAEKAREKAKKLADEIRQLDDDELRSLLG